MLPAEVVRGGGRRRRSQWGWSAAVVIVVIVASVALVARNVTPIHNVPTGDHRSKASQGIPVSAASRRAAVRADPLSAKMHVDCVGASVPVAALAEPGGTERGRSPASAVLRRFLADDPYRGTVDVHGGNWLLLSNTDNELVFGQRHGPIGVGDAVALTREGRTYQANQLGGCGEVTDRGAVQGEVFQAHVSGRTLTLMWMNGNCDGPNAPADRAVSRVETRETQNAVHVLILSKLTAAGRHSRSGVCFGVGLTSTTSVQLRAPLGNRALIDDAVVPGERAQRQ